MATDESFTSWIEYSLGETIRFGDLGRLMATALHGETFAAAAAEINLEDELPKLVLAGVLKPRDPLTNGPHPFPHGAALKDARLRPDAELRAFLADRGIGLRMLPTFVLEARPQRVPPELAALPDGARVMFTGPTTTGVGKASDLRDMIQDAMARQRDGFFEVCEVAQVLAEARRGDWRDFTEDMRKAWQNGQLRMRYPVKRTVRTGPENRFSAFEWVSVDDVNAWLKADGCGYEFPAAPEAAEAPFVAPVSSAANPPPLETPDIADAFDGVHGQTAKQWRDKLGDVNNHRWLLPARAAKAAAPKRATWWPVALAELLLERGATADSLNRAFLTLPKLKPWLPLWQEKRRERNAFGRE